MNRRGFLRTLGKGAAAAVAPKGAIAKALTAESPVESINTLIRGYLKNDIDGIVNFPKIHSTFTTLFSFIKRHNLDSLLDKKEIRRIEGCIKSSSPEGIQAAIKQIKEMDLEDGFIRNDSNTALHEYEISFGESGCDYDALAYILNPLAQKNLIDKETAKVIKDVMGCDVRDFIQTPEMKAERKKRLQQDTERAMKQYEYNKTAQGIDYSRMDKAGGAEDTDYAKYYEKVNTFDSLLSFIKEEEDDDMSDMFDTMADVMSPEGKKVYYDYTLTLRGYGWDDDNDYIDGGSTDYLPHDAKFVIPGLWYRKWSQEDTYTSTWITYYFTDKPLAIKWKNFTENWNKRPGYVDNIDPETARLVKIIHSPIEHENI